MSLLKDARLEEINRKIINTTIEKCGNFYNARILVAIKSRWIRLYEGKGRNKVPRQTREHEKPEEISPSSEDDDFEGAEVEEKELEDSSFTTGSDDELKDLDNISISDLSDVDPPTDNIIIAVCDKLLRPTGRRRINTNWKLKLKGGLMKVDGKEVFFNGLQGELGF